MKRLLRNKFILFPVLAVLLGLLFVPTSTYANLIVNALLSQVDSAKLHLAVRKPDLAFIGLYSEEVVIRPQQSPIGITLQEVKIRPRFRDLLSGQLTVKITGKWLNGPFLIHWGPLRDTVSLKLAEVQLHRFSPLLGIGLQKGNLDAEVRELQFRKDGTVSQVETVTLALSNVEKPSSTTLGPRVTGLPFPITLPELRDTSLAVRGKGDQEKVVLKEMKLQSNLGKLSGGAEFTTGRNPTIMLLLNGSLSEQGFEQFGSAMSLFSGGKVKNAHQPFKITASGPLRPAPDFKILPIEQSP